jgi:hypothetical protein
MNLLMPQTLEQVHFRPQNKKMGKLSVEHLKETFGFTDEQIEEVNEAGFLLMYNDGQNSIILLPSKRFLFELCRKCGISKLNTGVDPLRDIYLASRMRHIEPFRLIYRTDEYKGKALCCASDRYKIGKQTIAIAMKNRLKEKFQNVVEGSWSINHFITSTTFLFPNETMTIKDTEITPGIQFTFSEVMDSQYVMEYVLCTKHSKVVIGQATEQKHSEKFDLDSFIETFLKANASVMKKTKELVLTLKAHENETIDFLTPIESILDKLHFSTVYGKKNAKVFKNTYLSKSFSTTKGSVGLFFLEIPKILRQEKEYITAEVQRICGKGFIEFVTAHLS